MSTGPTAATDTALAALAERLDALEARAAIGDLYAGYAHGFDEHDVDRFLAIWHEDGVWHFPEPVGTVNGRAAIGRVLRALWRAAPATRHWMTDITLRLDAPDEAVGDAHAIVWRTDADGGEEFLAAGYQGRYERRDDAWRIVELTMTIHWARPLASVAGPSDPPGAQR